MDVRKIISGGQTGVDRGALDAAIELGIEHGGWCPRFRRAEDGPIPERYQLREMDSTHYHHRTEQNVVDSDATLMITRGTLSGGTELTRRMAIKHRRPHRVVQLDQLAELDEVRQWLVAEQVGRLNVAGPRESSSPGIGEQARQFIRRLFDDATDPVETESAS